MVDNKLEHIYRKCLNATATVDERREFMNLIRLPENEEIAKNLLSASFLENNRDGFLDDLTADGMIEAILLADRQVAGSGADLESVAVDTLSAGDQITPLVHRVHFLKTAWFRYAAAILILFCAATYFWLNNHSGKELAMSNNKKHLQTDISPGTNKAVLTIDNKQIDLASDKAGIRIGNEITYMNGEIVSDAGRILTLTTPKGGQYQLVLPDGSKIWLNAESSIKFPSVFTNGKRHVDITGEVYMEIAQNAKQPFVVSSGESEIQVLGTSFNVNAYQDEGAFTTTLVDGSVKVDQEVVLKPGQQCSVVKGNASVINNADINQVLAWKNGIFNFNGLKIKSVMRQLEKWYDIKVQYKSAVSNELTFVGKMYRNVSLSSVLKMLEDMGVKFEMDGKTLIIL